MPIVQFDDALNETLEDEEAPLPANLRAAANIDTQIGTSTQTAINALDSEKEDNITAGTSAQLWQGDKTWVAKTALPISTATQAALDLRAFQIADCTGAATETIPAGLETVVILALKAAVGQGPAKYRKVSAEPVHCLKFQNDGDWWEIDESQLTPAMAGAIGDGSTHLLSSFFGSLGAAQAVYPHVTSLTEELDWAAIQAVISASGATGKGVFIAPKGAEEAYLINKPLIFKETADLPTTPTGEDIHKAQLNRMSIRSEGAEIKATAAMDYMMKYTYDTVDSDLTPFYPDVRGLKLNGNALAVNAIDLDWSMHAAIEHNLIYGFTTAGIVVRGRGGHRLNQNTILGPKCIVIGHDNGTDDYGGGDSVLTGNDLYPEEIAIDCGLWSGNTEIGANTITRGEAATMVYGVRLSADYSADASKQVNDVRVLGNEFRGIDVAVYGRRSAAGRNLYNIQIEGNHLNAYDTENSGVLADMDGCDDLDIGVNWINYKAASAATGSEAIKLDDCQNFSINHSHANNLNGRFATITDCTDGTIEGNLLKNIGMSGATEKAILLNGSTTRVGVNDNKLRQDSASYGQYFLVEEDTADANILFLNRLSGVANRSTLIGASSGEFQVRASGTGQMYLQNSLGTVVKFGKVASPANWLSITPSSTGNAIVIAPEGSDADIWLQVGAKANGLLQFVNDIIYSAGKVLRHSLATGLTATGTTQGTALALTSTVNELTTVASGTGAVLPASKFGARITVINAGANALLVYPPSGAAINALATDAGYSLAAGAQATFSMISSTKVYGS